MIPCTQTANEFNSKETLPYADSASSRQLPGNQIHNSCVFPAGVVRLCKGYKDKLLNRGGGGAEVRKVGNMISR